MTNSISKRNQSEQADALSKQLGASRSVNNKMRLAITSNAALNFTNNKALSAVKAANQAEIARLNQEYIVKTQDVLNEQALDFLVKNSMINAPTLTSIVAGFELARASRADKLNEQRQFDVDNIQQRNIIAQEQVSNANAVNDTQSELIQSGADIEQQNLRSGFAQESVAIRADISDNEVREAEVRGNTQRGVERDARQDDVLEAIAFRAQNRPIDLSNQTEAQRFAALGRTGQPTAPTTTSDQIVESVQPATQQNRVVGQSQSDVDVVPEVQQTDGVVSTSAVNTTNQLSPLASAILGDFRRGNDVPIVNPDGSLGEAIDPVNIDDLTPIEVQVFQAIKDQNLDASQFSKQEEQMLVNNMKERNNGQITPFGRDPVLDLDPEMQRDIISFRAQPLISQFQGVQPQPNTSSIEPTQAEVDGTIPPQAVNPGESESPIIPPALQVSLAEQGIDPTNLTPQALQELIDAQEDTP